MGRIACIVLLLLLGHVGLAAADQPGAVFDRDAEGRAVGGDPVDLFTGLYWRGHDDLMLLGPPMSIVLTRTYRNRDPRPRAFGIGTNHRYDWFLVGDSREFSWVEMIRDDGSRIRYRRVSPGTDFGNAVFVHTATPTEYYNSRLRWYRSGWTLERADGTTFRFRACSPGGGDRCALVAITDRLGRSLAVTRDARGRATRISTDPDRWIEFAYDADDRIVRAEDSLGGRVTYDSDSHGRLVRVVTAGARAAGILDELAERVFELVIDGVRAQRPPSVRLVVVRRRVFALHERALRVGFALQLAQPTGKGLEWEGRSQHQRRRDDAIVIRDVARATLLLTHLRRAAGHGRAKISITRPVPRRTRSRFERNQPADGLGQRSRTATRRPL